MATSDGSGDIGYSLDEMRDILTVIQEAVSQCPPGGYLTFSESISKKGVNFNIRHPRLRGPVEHMTVIVRPYGSSNL